MLSPTNPALSAHARSAPPRAWLIAIAVCALPLMAAWWLTIRMSVDFYAADNSGDQMFFTFGAIFMMWAVMMAAMMLPSVFPATLLFARLNHEWQKTGAFVFGYLSAWLVFSLARRGTVVAYALGRLGRKLGLVIKHRARRAFGLCRCLSI